MAHDIQPTTLRDTADNIHSRGPGIAAAHLRSAADRIDALKDAIDKERASIVAFLAAEAQRFDVMADVALGQGGATHEVCVTRLHAQASLLRTLAMQVARGDDRNGCDPTPNDIGRFGSASDREVER